MTNLNLNENIDTMSRKLCLPVCNLFKWMGCML